MAAWFIVGALFHCKLPRAGDWTLEVTEGPYVFSIGELRRVDL